jgi:hypothetical protein
MLAVLLRDAPKEAMELLAKEPSVDFYPANKVYETLHGTFPAEMLVWLRAEVKQGTPRSGTAAYELSLFGEAADRLLIEDRLSALRTQWQGRDAEVKDAVATSPAQSAKSEEMNLVSALVGAKVWHLSDEERLQLTEGCMSDWCMNYAPRKPVPPARSTQ